MIQHWFEPLTSLSLLPVAAVVYAASRRLQLFFDADRCCEILPALAESEMYERAHTVSKIPTGLSGGFQMRPRPGLPAFPAGLAAFLGGQAAIVGGQAAILGGQEAFLAD